MPFAAGAYAARFSRVNLMPALTEPAALRGVPQARAKSGGPSLCSHGPSGTRAGRYTHRDPQYTLKGTL
jgi:hypothetical protein